MGVNVSQATTNGDLPSHQLMQDHAKAVHVSLQPRGRHSMRWVWARLDAISAGCGQSCVHQPAANM